MSTTQTANEIPGFAYEPLPDAGSYIRLITKLDFDETRPISIHCEVTIWPLSEAPRYHAISYAWGDPDNTVTILVNGTQMTITHNCEYTLKQATWYGGDFRRRYYWVDAICINQQDDEEKGPQVAFMAQIYTNAERVLACVGESDASSRYIYRISRKDSRLLRMAGLAESTPPVVMAPWQSKPESTLARAVEALVNFFARPYFERLWVYPELYLGKQINFCCGKEHASFVVFYGLIVTALQLWSHSVHTIDQLDALTDAWFMFRDASVLSAWRPVGLTRLLSRVWRLKCTEPRDMIYAMLPLIDWSNKAPIYPDYTKDKLALALEVLRIMHNEGGARPYVWLYTVEHLSESLHLSRDMSPRLDHAIRKRQMNVSAHCAGNDHNQMQRSRILGGFRGLRLTFEDGRWNFERQFSHSSLVYSPMSTRKYTGYMALPVYCRPNDVVLLPPVAQHGDWCVGSDSGMLLIARPRDDGHFDILGKALAFSLCWFGEVDFQVYLDHEDAIVLSLSNREHRKRVLRGQLDDEMTEYLETRVCGRPGSSYAAFEKPGGRNDSWDDLRKVERNMRFG